MPFSLWPWATHRYWLAFVFLSIVLFWRTLGSLASLSLHDERSSHIALIPIFSAFLIYLERRSVFNAVRFSPLAGIPVLISAFLLWVGVANFGSSMHNTDLLSARAALIVLVWIAAFVLFYGIQAFRAAAFPLLFLFLMIPLPVVLVEKIVSVLQKGSAETCYALFRLLQVPVVRHGFVFSLPGVDIEVAEQCSGIHSALSLFIAGLLAQHLLLKSSWKKILFTLCIFPIAIFKNAIRIVTISWLGIHINSGIFFGALHRQGGLPFSLVALTLMALVLWLLARKSPVQEMRLN